MKLLNTIKILMPIKLKVFLYERRKKIINAFIINKRKQLVLDQKKYLSDKFDTKTKKIIIFFVPDCDIVSGGIMSILSIYAETLKLKKIHKSEVLLCTFPLDNILFRFTKFENEAKVFSFNAVLELFKEVEEIIIHLPEIYASRYRKELDRKIRSNLPKLKRKHVNILNQNILLMPSLREIIKIKSKVERLTCTTAHKQYCTVEYHEKYGIPLHHFSAENLFAEYIWCEYEDKEDLLMYSPDYHPSKGAIISTIRHNYPSMELIEINNMTFKEYLDICRRAKWSITFGEGLDGYFSEPVYCGACSFAIYNTEFFTEDFQNLKTIYNNHELFLENIVEDLRRNDSKELYVEINKSILDLLDKQYNISEYKNNIKLFYLGEYTFG